ncbi:MAG: hypothetical protein K2Y40_02570 [Reyranella sp.]|nr:hypothetical protein [Reyranella sp.]
MADAARQCFGIVDRQCVAKLKRVSFGVHNSAERMMVGVAHAMETGRPISEAQRLAMYRLCFRYREQIADWSFLARVLICTALIEEMTDVEYREAFRPRVRGWRAGAASSRADRNPLDDLFREAR